LVRYGKQSESAAAEARAKQAVIGESLLDDNIVWKLTTPIASLAARKR
jgi:hypothetical protein